MGRRVVAVRTEASGERRRSGAFRRECGRLERLVVRWATRMLAVLELAEAELSVVLCDDAFILELNRRFADEDHATDVLAFASTEAPGPRTPGLLGDVVISIETARRQADARAASLDDEVKVLLGHGLLHLLGYDHRRAPERRIMVARTAELVEAAGVVRPRRKKAQ